jgi:hypothetical protein
VWRGPWLLAEVRDLRLVALCLREHGRQLLDPHVPLPLFWEQYADHENPERNASSRGKIHLEEETLVCRGSTGSGSAISTFRLSFLEESPAAFALVVDALLEIPDGPGWLITPNPHHGEIEFCNLWPAGSFHATASRRKLYSTTAVKRGSDVTLIPHNHLESEEKQNIRLEDGDQVAWLLEDENPVLILASRRTASAGLCAYMWDMHFAYKACTTGSPLVLSPGSTADARYRISSMSREEGEEWLKRGRRAASREAGITPVYLSGLNTFRDTFASAVEESHLKWPWVFQATGGTGGEIAGALDRSTGVDDASSVCIRSTERRSGRWVATTLGPAFGEPPDRASKRFRLSAMVRTHELDGQARVALRLHRTGHPDLHHPESYEEFSGGEVVSGTTGWKKLSVTTPPIVPEPDRVHIHLIHEGKGTSWFDNILFEETD